MLDRYITEVQLLLNDTQGQFFSLPNLTTWINRARRLVAAVSGCVRIVPPGTQTIPRQETYPFKNWTALCQELVPGTEGILFCRSLADGIGGKWGRRPRERCDPSTVDGEPLQIIGGAWKPMWRRVVWTDFQARFRIYGGTFMGTLSEPGWWAQFGEGPIGVLYLAPIPTQANPMEVDLTLVPSPLTSDKDPEPIPYPWSDAVAYWAAVLLLTQQQRAQDAQAMAVMFNTEMPMCASVVCPQMIQHAYGATLRSA